MKAVSMKEIERNSKKQSLKSMYFNRYLVVRYTTAFFFFTNINWLLALIIQQSKALYVPLLLTLSIFPAILEQIKLYNRPTNQMPWTRSYYFFQIVVNILLVLALWTSVFNDLFPFMVTGLRGEIFMLAILIFGVSLAGMILRRLFKIQANVDRHYARILKYQKSLNLEEEHH